jgi:pyruvate dehydrogenase E1 component alpha subunit
MTDLDSALLVRLYREMVRLRRLDERLGALARQGRIGFYGAAFGQEATPVAAALAIDERDWIFPALRESGAMLVRGYPLVLYVAQLFGCELDPMKGRQMPSHMASRSVRQVSWSSCIATQLPHAVGAAWAARRAGRSEVMLAFLGDGATSHPDFHAALNFAGLWRAPVVFVCQNNQYAISVPAARQSASESFAIKARAYGFEGERIDGNDAVTIYERVRTACERARRGEGPHFIECLTYRLGPHSTSDDPSRYRPEGELELWQSRDPVARQRRRLEERGLLAPDLDDSLIRELDEELSAAIEKAESAAPPPLRSLCEDVYRELPWHLEEQLLAIGEAGRARS